MAELVYLNGSLVPRSKARLSVYDHGFLYGYGLYETMRAYHGKIFLLERHIKRLLDTAEIIGLAPKLAGTDLGKACVDTLAANNLEDARIRLTVSNGESEVVPWAGVSGAPTVVVTTRPYAPFSKEKYSHGFEVGVASVRRCRQSVVASMKSVNYLASVMARMEAAAHGLDEALLLNDAGFIAEGGGCNVFFVKNSGLITPSLESGILPGITRRVVIELAGALDISVNEGDVGLADLGRFGEAFLTNAMIELMPLVAVRGEAGQTVTIGSGRPGEITKRLMAAYKERVERETSQG
jgi:branched-chain amino acid aminotransferase group I